VPDITTLPVEPRWLHYAERECKHFGRREIHDDVHYIGILGELAFGSLLRSQGVTFDYVANDCRAWDFIAGGARIDVKTQRLWSDAPPSRDWFSTIIAEQAGYDCDEYVFALLHWPKESTPLAIHFMSAYPTAAWHNHPEKTFHQAGEVVVNMTVHRDCYMLRHSCMPSVDTLIWHLENVI
jgi:hypothetical protein